MRKYAILAVVGIVLLGITSAMAASRSDLQAPTLPGVTEGQAYDRDMILPDDTRLISLPVPEPDQGNQPTSFQKGPVATGDSKVSPRLGSAIVAPRGGAVYTPKQSADRQIKQLIRRLD